MAILLNDNLDIAANKPVDNRYGPYATVALAISGIPSFKRHIGLTVGIGLTNTVDYWFKAGTGDTDLIEKVPTVNVPVTSVAGKTGAVTLVKGDVGLGNVDNTSDANKPVSTATQTALNAKQDILVSGTSIKTINGNSLLGAGDIAITGGGGSGNTNLSYTASPTGGTVVSDTGNDATLTLADTTNAGLMSPADKTKLNGVATNANNYTHPNHTGDVTSAGDGATAIGNNVVTNAKLAQIAANTIKGRATTGTGNVEDLTAAQVRTILNVADGATANAAAAVTPQPLGTAAVGTATAYARADHVHALPTASDIGAQATLVSGTNIKSINGTSLLGGGDISIGSGGTQVNSDWAATTGVAQILNKPVNATTTVGGLMSSTDKQKLDNLGLELTELSVNNTSQVTLQKNKHYFVLKTVNGDVNFALPTSNLSSNGDAIIIRLNTPGGATGSVIIGAVGGTPPFQPLASLNSQSRSVKLVYFNQDWRIEYFAKEQIDLSEITNSGATTGQVPKWNGTAWAPADDSGGAGATNLSYTASATGGTVLSDTGSDATLTLADTTNAGLMSPADKTKLNGLTGPYAALVNGKVPESQLPSYVDDVIEAATQGTRPNPGEIGKIYVTLDDNKCWRWTGTTYIEISPSSGQISAVAGLQEALNGKQATIFNTATIPVAANNQTFLVSTYYPNNNGADLRRTLTTITFGAAVTSGTTVIRLPQWLTTGLGAWKGDQALFKFTIPQGVTVTFQYWGLGVWNNLTTFTTRGVALNAAFQATIETGTTANDYVVWEYFPTLYGAAQTIHTHQLGDLTQSGATEGQVIKWNGTNWVPGDDNSSTGGSGNTNLSYTASPTGGTVVSDTGNDATLPLATTTNAGLMAPIDKTKLTQLSLEVETITVSSTTQIALQSNKHYILTKSVSGAINLELPITAVNGDSISISTYYINNTTGNFIVGTAGGTPPFQSVATLTSKNDYIKLIYAGSWNIEYFAKAEVSLTDITQSGATEGQVIKWNGTNWVPGDDNSDGTGSGITEVTVTPPISGTQVNVPSSEKHIRYFLAGTFAGAGVQVRLPSAAAPGSRVEIFFNNKTQANNLFVQQEMGAVDNWIDFPVNTFQLIKTANGIGSWEIFSEYETRRFLNTAPDIGYTSAGRAKLKLAEITTSDNGSSSSAPRSALKISDTWEYGFTAFDSILLDVTDSSSAQGSNLINLRIDGESKFSVTKTGITKSDRLEATQIDLVSSPATLSFRPDGTTELMRILAIDESFEIGYESPIGSIGADPFGFKVKYAAGDTEWAKPLLTRYDETTNRWYFPDAATQESLINKIAMTERESITVAASTELLDLDTVTPINASSVDRYFQIILQGPSTSPELTILVGTTEPVSNYAFSTLRRRISVTTSGGSTRPFRFVNRTFVGGPGQFVDQILVSRAAQGFPSSTTHTFIKDNNLNGAAWREETFAVASLTQSGATEGQVIKWNGTNWAPGDDTGGGSSNWSEITNTPTTLSGYGITDALSIYPDIEVFNTGVASGVYKAVAKPTNITSPLPIIYQKEGTVYYLYKDVSNLWLLMSSGTLVTAGRSQANFPWETSYNNTQTAIVRLDQSYTKPLSLQITAPITELLDAARITEITVSNTAGTSDPSIFILPGYTQGGNPTLFKGGALTGDIVIINHTQSATGTTLDVRSPIWTGSSYVTSAVAPLTTLNKTGRWIFRMGTGSWSVLAVPQHTHPVGDLTQSGATTGQVIKWNGTVWAPGDDTGGAGGGMTWSAVPQTAGATGTAGQMAYADNYLYVCVGPNTWKRTILATW